MLCLVAVPAEETVNRREEAERRAGLEAAVPGRVPEAAVQEEEEAVPAAEAEQAVNSKGKEGWL